MRLWLETFKGSASRHVRTAHVDNHSDNCNQPITLRSPSTFEAQAAAIKRSPSGTMAAIRVPDTDPAPPPIPREEPE